MKSFNLKSVIGKVYSGLLLAMILGLTTTSVMAGLPFASGHGNLTVDGELRTFSFVAMEKKSGEMSGQMELNNRATLFKIHAEIDCLDIRPGNTAVVSGFITDPDTSEPIRSFIFTVVDNGEGNNDPTDQMTLVFITGEGNVIPDLCLTNPPGTLLPIEAGNIQVRQ